MNDSLFIKQIINTLYIYIYIVYGISERSVSQAGSVCAGFVPVYNTEYDTGAIFSKLKNRFKL